MSWKILEDIDSTKKRPFTLKKPSSFLQSSFGNNAETLFKNST